MNVSHSRRNFTSTHSNQSAKPLGSEYDGDLDQLLHRWGKWLRAGESGLSTVGRCGGGLRDEEYRDVVAEMLDQLIAGLPKQQKWAIMAIWCHQASETSTADLWGMPRARFKAILCRATGWLCGSLSHRIDAAPTVENVMRWEKRQ